MAQRQMAQIAGGFFRQRLIGKQGKTSPQQYRGHRSAADQTGEQSAAAVAP